MTTDSTQTTVVAEEIWMQFVANKEESQKEQSDSALDKLKATNRGVVKCRICKEDHWTTQCPYKDTLGPLRESLTGPVEGEGGPDGAGAATALQLHQQQELEGSMSHQAGVAGTTPLPNPESVGTPCPTRGGRIRPPSG